MKKYILIFIMVLQQSISNAQDLQIKAGNSSKALELKKQYTRQRWVAAPRLKDELIGAESVWANVTFYNTQGKPHTTLMKIDKEYLLSLSKSSELQLFFIRLSRDINKGIILHN